MDTPLSPPLSSHNGAALNPSFSSSRRILVVTDHNAADSALHGDLCFSHHSPEFHLDYRDVHSLWPHQGPSAPRPAQRTGEPGDEDRMARFSMLGKYQLILVPNERIRAALCDAMPGLARNVYALDCFAPLRGSHEPTQSGAPEHSDPLDDGLSHWSTFLSQLVC